MVMYNNTVIIWTNLESVLKNRGLSHETTLFTFHDNNFITGNLLGY